MAKFPQDAFTRIRGRAATVIARFGAEVQFFADDIPSVETSPGVWSQPVAGLTFIGDGISTKGDPEALKGLGSIPQIILESPLIVLVAAQRPDGTIMEGTPTANLKLRWPYDASAPDTGTVYNINGVAEVAPNGRPIYYVVGARV